MANIKISALPQYSALTDADIWFVVNNSGETETFKIQLKEFLGLVNGTGLNSLKSASFLTATPASADTQASIAIGEGAYTSGGDYAIAIGNAAYSLNEDGTAIGNNSHVEADGGTAYGAIARAEGIGSTSIGYSSGAFGQGSVSLGNGAQTSEYGSIAIGLNTNCAIPESQMIGGSGNTMNPGNTGQGRGSSILGSFDSLIDSDGWYNAIYNSQSSSIQNAVSGATMIGTQSRVGDTDDTTYVENLRTFGQYYSNGSLSTGSTITIDFNTGNIHHIEVTGNLDLTLLNVKNGARYVIVTTTTGNFNINSKTAAGFTFVTDSGFDSLGNGVSHLMTLDVIGDKIYGTHTASLT
jgi:hypothetical protein